MRETGASDCEAETVHTRGRTRLLSLSHAGCHKHLAPGCNAEPQPGRRCAACRLFADGFRVNPDHKSGIAVRFPRMLRSRGDKPAAEADTIGALRALIAG